MPNTPFPAATWMLGILVIVASSPLGLAQQSKPLQSKPAQSLEDFQQRFAKPQLVLVADHVHAALGYQYSNFGFIASDNGVIVIDTGWFPGGVQPAWDAYRNICDKPVKAIIYTHVHGDHTGGASVFVKDASEDLEIFAPVGWDQRRNYVFTSQFHMIYRRAYAQMGMLLPDGDAGTAGSGIGPSPRPIGVPKFVPPTVTVSQTQELSIDGVRLKFIVTPGDIQSHMMVWMPAENVLFCGDILGGTLPYIATPRFEPGRDPYGFIESLDISRKLKPKEIVPGHGRLLRGRSDVEEVLQANIDVIRFLADQTQRMVSNGLSPDQIIERIRLPPALANHPDLQPHYHRQDWIIRGLALKQAGFMNDMLDLSRHSDKQESQRIVELLGGPEKTLKHADAALENDDPRWALRLATQVLQVYENDESAKVVRVAAMRKIAKTTRSASERNYLLTAVKEETEGVDWVKVLSAAGTRVAGTRESSALLTDMSLRFQAERFLSQQYVLEIQVKGEPSHFLVCRRGSLVHETETALAVDGRIELSRELLNRIWGKQLTWLEALEKDELKIISGADSVANFLALIE